MQRVAFVWDGERHEAALVNKGTKHARVGWLEAEVPTALAPLVETRATRPQWRSMKVPLQGPNAVNLEYLPPVPNPTRRGGRVQGVKTAELAKALGEFIRDQGWDAQLQVICSHPGDFQGEREPDLTGAGVLLRQVAFFIGEDHTRNTRVGVSDIAVVTTAEPRRAVLLIEIEENASGTEPKTVIGDALLPILADRIDILGTNDAPIHLSVQGAGIWVGYHPRRGVDVTRTKALETKLNASGYSPEGGASDRPAIRLFNEKPETLYDTLLEKAKEFLTNVVSRPAR
jgi:hypothetical protein